MRPQPPDVTPTDTLIPYTTLFRSVRRADSRIGEASRSDPTPALSLLPDEAAPDRPGVSRCLPEPLEAGMAGLDQGSKPACRSATKAILRRLLSGDRKSTRLNSSH